MTSEQRNKTIVSFLTQNNKNTDIPVAELLSFFNCVEEKSQQPFIKTPFPYSNLNDFNTNKEENNILSQIIQEINTPVKETTKNTYNLFNLTFTQDKLLNKLHLSAFVFYFMCNVLISVKADKDFSDKFIDKGVVEEKIRLLFLSAKKANGKDFLDRTEKKILYMTLLSIPKLFSAKVPGTTQTPAIFFKNYLCQMFTEEKDVSILEEIANMYGSFNYWHVIFPYRSTHLLTKNPDFINDKHNLGLFIQSKINEINEEISDSCNIRNGTIEQMGEKFNFLFRDKILCNTYGQHFFQFGTRLFYFLFINEFYYLWDLNPGKKAEFSLVEKKILNHIFQKIQAISLFYTKDPEPMIVALFDVFKALLKASFSFGVLFNNSLSLRRKGLDILVNAFPLKASEKKVSKKILETLLEEEANKPNFLFEDQNLFMAWKQEMMKQKFLLSFLNETTESNVDR